MFASAITQHCRLVGATSLVLILAGSLVGIIVPAGLGWDFANYYDTGRRVAAGDFENLYDPAAKIAGEEPQGSMRFYGVPLSGFLYVPFSWFEPVTASRILKLACAVALVSMLYVVSRHCCHLFADDAGTRTRLVTLIWVLALLYQPFWSVYRVGGQTTPIVVLLLAIALVWHTAGRVALSSLCWAIVILIKPAFVLPALLLVFTSGRRMLLYLVGWSVLAATLSVATTGYGTNVAFVELVLSSTKISVSWVHNSALTVPIENLRLLTDTARHSVVRPLPLTIGIMLVRALVLGLYVYVVLATRTCKWSRQSRAHFLFLASLTFGLCMMPIVWEHYLSALFLPMVCLFAFWRRLSVSSRRMLMATFGLAALQNLILVEFIAEHWQCDTLVELLIAGMVKGGPLLLILTLYVCFCREIGRAYASQCVFDTRPGK